jgi:hypothetical protein
MQYPVVDHLSSALYAQSEFVHPIMSMPIMCHNNVATNSPFQILKNVFHHAKMLNYIRLTTKVIYGLVIVK